VVYKSFNPQKWEKKIVKKIQIFIFGFECGSINIEGWIENVYFIFGCDVHVPLIKSLVASSHYAPLACASW
jgi:hypothetical protein